MLALRPGSPAGGSTSRASLKWRPVMQPPEASPPRSSMERTCVGCRRVRPKAVMVRIVRGPDGSVNVDRSGHAPGRGAYVCGRECLRLARGRLGRALRARGYDYGVLESALGAGDGEER